MDPHREEGSTPGSRLGRRRAAVYAAIVVVAGATGMVGYWLLVGQPVTRWPRLDSAVMVLTTVGLAVLVRIVTGRLLGDDRPHAKT